MKGKVLVAMSGGVDSSVAAWLLAREGYQVLGATMKTWASESCDKLHTRSCCSREGVEDARRIASRLGIPYAVFDFEKEFKEAVVDYFSAQYLAGMTPNPCIVCNEKIKFRLFRKRAEALGAQWIATGHYARVGRDGASGRYFIEEGLDHEKDQSYVLFSLSQEELAPLVLPLGGLKKTEVRKIAKEAGFPLHDKPDSQEICFIPDDDYAGFLARELSLEGRPGNIRDRNGKILGTHPGYFHFTIGQRRGLGIAHPVPLYVTGVDCRKNEVIVGPKEEVASRSFLVENLHWMLPLKEGGEGRFQVKIRSAHRRADAAVRAAMDGAVRVEFDKPQEAITPGQAAVFYDGSRIAGGGWIREVLG